MDAFGAIDREYFFTCSFFGRKTAARDRSELWKIQHAVICQWVCKDVVQIHANGK
jgi:hypothetical protein